MSAEPGKITNTECWTQWESQVVNGVFPLRRLLGSSDHSAVFLTEYKARNLPDAAIKFVPADALRTQAQLAQLRTTATLSHPHLIRLFDVGRYQFAGREFLFVVMEHAEQTLAQILARRALNLDEAQQLLLPTLDALAFLHRNHLVHGQLKPSNFLAVNDQLKLASDTVRSAGNSAIGMVRTSSYDPPELKDSGISPAGDIWGLGMTLVESLTQRTPAWSAEQGEMVPLPANFPTPFVDTVRRCLSIAPANRPTVIELEAQYKPVPQAHSISEPQPPANAAPREAKVNGNGAPQSFPKRYLLLLTIAAALLISLAVWKLHFSGTSQAQLQPPAISTPVPVAPSTSAKPAESVSPPRSKPALLPSATSPAVLLEVNPDIPGAILSKIQGRIFVTVRVLVDSSGNVVGALLENPGRSKYFARVASDAAREWKFVPADKQGIRVWLLRFAFSRDGVTTRATAM